MKVIFSLVALSIFSVTFSQDMKVVDSVSVEMCDYLKTIEISNDTLKINALYEDMLYPYLGTLEESKTQKVSQQIYYRLQRNCVEFRDLLDRLEPPKEAVTRITKKPKSTISKKELETFKKRKDFYYFEVSGDTTHVIMEDGSWTDLFVDETVSKLTYEWINDTEFKLVFVESDNESRVNFSVKGDQYVYKVLSKKANLYNLSVNIPGQKTYEMFKIYFK